MMKADVLENYIERVYGFAVNHTFSREEADELSQEILFTAVRELPKLKDCSRLEPWLWGIAGNVTKVFRRRMGRQRAMYSYDTLEHVPYEDEYGDENEELYDALRTKIAMLSETYRHIIILFYYDGLSTKRISEKLSIPEGTVTWRLSEAHRKLKKECVEMDKAALKPVKLTIRINGDGNYKDPISPFPHVYIQDALSQNILYHCYETPKTVEELARHCGVPAYYIEDCLQNLIYREAMSEISKGKYQTDFIIYSDKTNAYSDKAKGIFTPVIDRFVQSMKALADRTDALGIYTAGKAADERIYLYGLMALEHLSQQHNPVRCTAHPVRYDGFRWSYHAYRISDTQYPIRGLGREQSANKGSRGTYQHISYHFGGFAYREMMLSDQINVCEDILRGKTVTDTEAAASAIERGFIARDQNGKLSVAVPAFTKKQYEAFTRLAEEDFASSIGMYAGAVSEYVAGYQKLFPARLEEEVKRACHYMFLTVYATIICDMARERGLLRAPSPDSVCDVMIQSKEDATVL